MAASFPHIFRQQTLWGIYLGKMINLFGKNNFSFKQTIRWHCKFPPPFVPLQVKFLDHPDRIAVVDSYGYYKYKDILVQSINLAERIKAIFLERKIELTQQRVSFLCPSDVSYVITKLACWLTGNVAVPLCRVHPTPQLHYFVEDSQSAIIVATDEFVEKVQPVADKLDKPFLKVEHPKNLCNKNMNIDINSYFQKENQFQEDYSKMKEKNALIIYTSGTTGPPKGVVLTHGNLHAQVQALLKAWEWCSNDVILHTLPLHHMHGIVNALLCPLTIGACCAMLPQFNAANVWHHLLHENSDYPQINVFMAVPTMYAKLVEEYDKRVSTSKNVSAEQKHIRSLCIESFRLMVSSSSALPEPVMQRWEDITGYKLLERFGMSEVGSALSSRLHTSRSPGFVGIPLPGVEVCIAAKNESSSTGLDYLSQGNEHHTSVASGCDQVIGELLVKGPNVFKEYWNKPQATQKAFTKDGWFMTGDTAQFVDGAYKILGRTSVDIIKSGGYKISALDVERHLLAHPDIADSAVVGLPDATWGEKVAAVITTKQGKEISLSELREWCKAHMPPYSIPSVLRCLPEMPRNVMGKVNKKSLVVEVFPEFMQK